MGFAASFIYIRVILFSQTLTVWLYRGYRSTYDWGNWNKLAGGLCVGGVLAVGYLWSYKLLIKVIEAATGKAEKEEDADSIEVMEHAMLEGARENEPVE